MTIDGINVVMIKLQERKRMMMMMQPIFCTVISVDTVSSMLYFVFVQDIHSSDAVCYWSLRQTPQCSEFAAVSEIVQSVTNVNEFQQPGKQILH